MLGIFITAGYPNYEKSLKALKILHELDVDLIELGVPFSDPLADGPVIQKASHEALRQGMNLDRLFEMIQATKINFKNFILFSYYNPLFVYEIDRLIEKSLEAGIRGFLVPDLPLEEAEKISSKFSTAGLDLILLAAITSSESRLEKIAKLSNPWIYLVSRIGITGSASDIADLKQNAIDEDLLLYKTLKTLKKYSNKKIAIGFGIDSPEKVKACLDQGADIAIVGSKAIKVLEEDNSENLDKFREFVVGLKAAAEPSSRGVVEA